MRAMFDRASVTYISSCPICDSSKVATICGVKTINAESSEMVMYLRCRACQHRFHNPLPNQSYLSILYSQGSRFVVGHSSGSSPDESPCALQRVVDNIFRGRQLKGASILEIGAGNGGFLRWLEQEGAVVAGVEPGQWGMGAPNTVHDISELKSQRFDVIVMLDVLEHLSDPIKMLNDLQQFASADTVLAVSFPSAQSPLSQLRRGRWRMVRPLGHLHYFSRGSINRAFTRSGWTVLEMRATRIRFAPMGDLLKCIYHALRQMRFKEAAGAASEALLGRDQWFVRATPAPR